MKDGFSASIECSIYVQFTDEESARKAAIALHGRKFAEKFVHVDYFDSAKFIAGVYE